MESGTDTTDRSSPMTQPALMMLVRFHSSLSLDEVIAVAEERMPEFQALEGLEQKYYLHDPETGEYGGVYFWRSPADLAEYRESELRSSIAEAYKVEGEPRIEILRVLMPLRSEVNA
jgi:heme-degrading monooxygenase HmoA